MTSAAAPEGRPVALEGRRPQDAASRFRGADAFITGWQMRRWFWVMVVLLLIVVGLWTWPFVGASQLASAAQRGDAAGVMERVDLPALRRSLARQIAGAYLKASGKTQKLGSLGTQFAGAAATTVADPYVADLLTPERITALIGQGKIDAVKVGERTVAIDRPLPNLADLVHSDLLAVVTSSYYEGIATFVIPVTVAQSDATYAVHLRLNGVTWRLAGLDLPSGIIDDMARSILKAEAPAGP